MKYNYDNGQKDFWGYEIGRTYIKVAEASEKNSGVKETQTLAGVITGNVQKSLWQSTGDVDFYTVKGIVDKVLEELIPERIRIDYGRKYKGELYGDTWYDKLFVEIRKRRYRSIIYCLSTILLYSLSFFKSSASFIKEFPLRDKNEQNKIKD